MNDTERREARLKIDNLVAETVRSSDAACDAKEALAAAEVRADKAALAMIKYAEELLAMIPDTPDPGEAA